MITTIELNNMSVEDRFKLFSEWVKNQPKDKEYDFNDRLDDADRRLRNIMNNIIKNNGEFIP